MAKYKVQFVKIAISDDKAIADMQKKINTWLTTGIVKKYEIHPIGNYLFFNICRVK
jgi:hypothetical protein